MQEDTITGRHQAGTSLTIVLPRSSSTSYGSQLWAALAARRRGKSLANQEQQVRAYLQCEPGYGLSVECWLLGAQLQEAAGSVSGRAAAKAIAQQHASRSQREVL